MITTTPLNQNSPKPFLKWAGGKTQLLASIQNALPPFTKKEPFTYIEPFVGSGAVLFWMLTNFKNLKRAIINDINQDLINTYNVIASNPVELIKILSHLQQEYHIAQFDIEKEKEYYYNKRIEFNSRQKDNVCHAALFIFLNRTCFNGLFRVNKNNMFNVPIGRYKQPTICDSGNIMAVNKVLQRVEITCGDFEETISYAKNETFFYLDPPYKPLNATSSFNSYSVNEFNDTEQIRLKDFCMKLNVLGHKWMLSNSDVKEKGNNSSFFDDIYSNFFISRVKAKRIINVNSEKRGELNELLITNYQNENTFSTA